MIHSVCEGNGDGMCMWHGCRETRSNAIAEWCCQQLLHTYLADNCVKKVFGAAYELLLLPPPLLLLMLCNSSLAGSAKISARTYICILLHTQATLQPPLFDCIIIIQIIQKCMSSTHHRTRPGRVNIKLAGTFFSNMARNKQEKLMFSIIFLHSQRLRSLESIFTLPFYLLVYSSVAEWIEQICYSRRVTSGENKTLNFMTEVLRLWSEVFTPSK